MIGGGKRLIVIVNERLMVYMEITKNQHYVSKGILKPFADEHKKIFELYELLSILQITIIQSLGIL